MEIHQKDETNTKMVLLVELAHFTRVKGPNRDLRTRLVVVERVGADDRGGVRDKGHSRGRFIPSPITQHSGPFFSPFFSLPERPLDHNVSRRCRFDDIRILWVSPL